jgi:Domain of unknown function (DUF4397)
MIKEGIMQTPQGKTARALFLVLPLVWCAACDDAARNAPVTTTTPAGQSTAPAANAAERRDTALVRVVHAIPTAAAVDILADDTPVFQKVSFKDVTPYRELDGQQYAFTVRAAGLAQGQALATNREGLDDGDYYTVFALPGDDAEPVLRIVEDNHARSGDGKARLRVVHAAASAAELDLYAPGRDDALVGGIDFRSVTDYAEIDPHTGRLDIRPQGVEQAIASVPDVRLEAGKTYTVVVVDGGRQPGRLEAFLIEDETAASPSTN